MTFLDDIFDFFFGIRKFHFVRKRNFPPAQIFPNHPETGRYKGRETFPEDGEPPRVIGQTAQRIDQRGVTRNPNRHDPIQKHRHEVETPFRQRLDATVELHDVPEDVARFPDKQNKKSRSQDAPELRTRQSARRILVKRLNFFNQLRRLILIIFHIAFSHTRHRRVRDAAKSTDKRSQKRGHQIHRRHLQLCV